MRLLDLLKLTGYYGFLLSKITGGVLSEATPSSDESSTRLVVVLENHYVLPAIEPYLDLSKHLNENHGFTQWRIERRKSKSQAQLLSDQKNVVQKMTTMVDKFAKSDCANDIFGQILTAEQLSVADDTEIEAALYCFKPTAPLEELELYKSIISSLPGSKLLLKQLKEIGAFMKVQGIDSDGVVNHLPEIVLQRNQFMVGKVVEAHLQGISQIVTVGKDHFVGFVLGLHKAGLLDQTFFIDLYSKQAKISNVPMTAFNQMVRTQQNPIFGPQRVIPQLSSIWSSYLNKEFKEEAREIETFSKHEQLPVNIISFNVDHSGPKHTALLDAVDQLLNANNAQGKSSLEVCKPSPLFTTQRFSLPEDVDSDITVTNKPMLFSKAGQHANAYTQNVLPYLTSAFMLFMGALAYKQYKNRSAASAVASQTSTVEQPMAAATTGLQKPSHRYKKNKRG